MAKGVPMPQDEFLGYMSNEQGWNYFVNTQLPMALTGQRDIIGGDGAPAGIAQLMAAVASAGDNLGGLTIPTNIAELATHPPPPPAPVTPVQAPQKPPDDGIDVLRNTLSQYGAGQDVIDMVVNLHNQGLDTNAVWTNVRGTPWWSTRFAGLVARKNSGIAPGTEADAIAYEQQMDSTLKQYGITGYSVADFQRWYGEDKSVAEMSGRANIAAQWAYAEPQEARDAAQRLWGIHAGDLTHYIFDDQHATPEIQRKLDAAEIAGSSRRAGFADLSADQAMRIGSYTTTSSAAAQLQKIAQQNALYKGLPGEGGDIGVDDIIGAYFGGDQNKLNMLRQRAAQRDFGQSGGGVSATGKGAVGAGRAPPT